MTLPEVAMALDDDTDKKRPPAGAAPMDAGGLAAHVEWLRRATPRERFEALREQYEE